MQRFVVRRLGNAYLRSTKFLRQERAWCERRAVWLEGWGKAGRSQVSEPSCRCSGSCCGLSAEKDHSLSSVFTVLLWLLYGMGGIMWKAKRRVRTLQWSMQELLSMAVTGARSRPV